MVRRLGEPASGAGQWRPIAADLRTYDESRGALVRASRAHDVAAWCRAHHRTTAVLTRLAVNLSAAPAPSGNACVRIFG